MSMTSKQIKEEFAKLTASLTKEEKVEIEAKLLIAQFISPILTRMESTGINRKSLAKEIGTSASFITQVFRGDKMINFATLAKIQNALGIKFEVYLKSDTNTDVPSSRYEKRPGFREIQKAPVLNRNSKKLHVIKPKEETKKPRAAR